MMLDYMNILTMPDKEVRDPVSGYSYPMSYNDVKAEHKQAQNEKQQRSMLSTLISMVK